jgi:SIR2-like domain
MEFENQQIFERALSKGINFFVGAGFSVLAKDNNKKMLPVGDMLTNELKKKFSLNGTYNLSQLSTILESSRREEFYNYLRERFVVKEFDDRYFSLNKFNIKAFYTTNIDDLIIKIVEKASNKYINDVSHNGSTTESNGAIDFSALHGSVLYNDRKMIFDTASLHNAYDNSQRAWNYLSNSIEKFPTIFWGYSLSDSGVIQALTSARSSRTAQKPKWIVLRQQEADTLEYFKAMGFQIVISDTAEMLDYLCNLQEATKDLLPGQITSDELRDFFNDNIVPKNAISQIKRSIADFFTGNPPVWSDIFGGQIYQTSHYNIIQNAVYSGKSTIVVGTPVSGKTTLMMQVAAHTQFSEGPKLIFYKKPISEQRADLLINILRNKKALIFIDNMNDSVEAFKKLKAASGITVLGFERTHNYGVISHLFEHSECNIINVTELTDQDIQGIYDTLPPEHRNAKLNIETNSNYKKDSIFEFVSNNVKYPSIKQRYTDVLTRLQHSDPKLAEFLVLCSYVHHTRIPLSFSMTNSYFGDSIKTYDEIFTMRERLGELLADYSGEYSDGDQDYYYPRSIHIAETILEVTDKNLLKTVINNALYNISSAQIPYYHIYRKSAYDKYLILKAFGNWEEGRDFYNDVYDYDFHNPYVLQQAALYLAQKKKYTEAFTFIDKAINDTNNKFFSIRNSHAIILFDANINSKGDSEEVRNELNKSMEILEKCFTNDRRKTYHAIRYAEQALEYSTRYYDDYAKKLLQKAKKFVNDELGRNSWDRDLKRLSNKLNSGII